MCASWLRKIRRGAEEENHCEQSEKQAAQHDANEICKFVVPLLHKMYSIVRYNQMIHIEIACVRSGVSCQYKNWCFLHAAIALNGRVHASRIKCVMQINSTTNVL